MADLSKKEAKSEIANQQQQIEQDESNMGKLGGLLLSHIKGDALNGQITFSREGPAEKIIEDDIVFKEPKFGMTKLRLHSRKVDDNIRFNSQIDDDSVTLSKIKGIKIKMQLLGELPLRELEFKDENGQRLMSAKLELPLWAQVIARDKYYTYKATLSQSADSPEGKLMRAYKESQKLAEGDVPPGNEMGKRSKK